MTIKINGFTLFTDSNYSRAYHNNCWRMIRKGACPGCGISPPAIISLYLGLENF